MVPCYRFTECNSRLSASRLPAFRVTLLGAIFGTENDIQRIGVSVKAIHLHILDLANRGMKISRHVGDGNNYAIAFVAY